MKEELVKLSGGMFTKLTDDNGNISFRCNRCGELIPKAKRPTEHNSDRDEAAFGIHEMRLTGNRVHNDHNDQRKVCEPGPSVWSCGVA